MDEKPSFEGLGSDGRGGGGTMKEIEIRGRNDLRFNHGGAKF